MKQPSDFLLALDSAASCLVEWLERLSPFRSWLKVLGYQFWLSHVKCDVCEKSSNHPSSCGVQQILNDFGACSRCFFSQKDESWSYFHLFSGMLVSLLCWWETSICLVDLEMKSCVKLAPCQQLRNLLNYGPPKTENITNHPEFPKRLNRCRWVSRIMFSGRRDMKQVSKHPLASRDANRHGQLVDWLRTWREMKLPISKLNHRTLWKERLV